MQCVHRIAATAAVVFSIVAAMATWGVAQGQNAERVRAIKPYFVAEPAGGDVRRYSGTIAAANTSALSFAVSGTVQSVGAHAGDRVVKGQILATLDTASFDLDVQAAQAQLASAQAASNKSKVDLNRQQQLFQKGWVAKAALDQAVAAFDAADGDLNLARSRLGLAERDLSNTRLTAPFDGVISLREVEPFLEVTKGQSVFQVDSEGALEVDISVPDNIVGRLSLGAPVTINASAVAGCNCSGRITEIGAAAGSANAVTVTAAIIENTQNLLPGMSVEATLVLSNTNGSRGFLVPLVAIAPGDDNAQGYIFKYDAASGVVQKTAVVGGGSISGNLISIVEGVDAGDVIAAAGVSFLRDGQRVKLLGE